MSLVKRFNGDVTKVVRGIICHGVNCQGVMGAGVALAIRNKWPKCFYDYIRHIEDNGGVGPRLLGTVAFTEVNSELFIAHCFTQNECTPGRVNADAPSIGKALNAAIEQAANFDLPAFAPEIGGLRGGLNFEKDVLPQITWAAENNNYPITVFSFKE